MKVSSTADALSYTDGFVSLKMMLFVFTDSVNAVKQL